MRVERTAIRVKKVWALLGFLCGLGLLIWYSFLPLEAYWTTYVLILGLAMIATPAISYQLQLLRMRILVLEEELRELRAELSASSGFERSNQSR